MAAAADAAHQSKREPRSGLWLRGSWSDEGSNPDPKIEHPYNGAVNETGQQIGSDDLALAAGGIGGGGDRHHSVDADHIP